MSEFIDLDDNIMPVVQSKRTEMQTDSDTCSSSYGQSVMASGCEAVMSEGRDHSFEQWIYKNITHITGTV